MNYNASTSASYLEQQFGDISLGEDGSYVYNEVSAQELYVQQNGGELYAQQGGYVTQQPEEGAEWVGEGWECGGLAADSASSLDSVVVVDLGPEDVRWFYKAQDSDKRWIEFSGYDSLRIEFKYRQLFHEWQHAACEAAVEGGEATPPQQQGEEPTEGGAYQINVRGGMYEVDLNSWRCISIYWPGEECAITRGSWFYDATWQPVDLEQSATLETVHLHMFYGHQTADYATQAPKKVVHTEHFPEFHVDWYSPSEVYLYSEAAPSKLVRTFTAKLGFHKSTGYRLRRGYKQPATSSDRPSDITHLVFVIHGIGHKMDQGRIIKNTTLLRDCVAWLRGKYHGTTAEGRPEFCPVEWRTSLKLDGDMVEAITPQKILGFRTLLNSSAMDIMYYTSPLYGSEVQRGLLTELNRLYAMFTQRNPYFVANGGKVSVIAHSLGCVILYDIVTGWKPDYWRRDTPTDLAPVSQTLDFQIDNMFCLGSPLSVFLALRWRHPVDGADTIIPPTLCNRLYNVFHPTDPVAYRMEPLLARGYARIAPLTLQSYNSANHVPYDDMPMELITSQSEATPTQVGVAKEDASDSPSRDRGWYLWGLMRGGATRAEAVAHETTSVLRHRVDYVLRETTIGVSYLSALTSHTTYWNNYDVAYFILTRLFPSLEVASAGTRSRPQSPADTVSVDKKLA